MEQINISTNTTDSLPNKKAVYAIYASDKNTGKPINCRYVGETDNLQERTGAHFNNSEQNEELKEFMQSNKNKKLVYELLPNSDKAERLQKEQEWIQSKKPQYNK